MTGKEHILLPSGLKIKFMNLRKDGREWIFDVYSKKNLEQRKIYGGKMLENICQALAGEICKEAAIQFDESLTGLVHDEIHIIAKRGLELVTKQKLQKAMITPPSWMPQIKLDCEIGIGKNWGDCKG
jgi:DNA polymerase